MGLGHDLISEFERQIDEKLFRGFKLLLSLGVLEVSHDSLDKFNTDSVLNGILLNSFCLVL